MVIVRVITKKTRRLTLIIKLKKAISLLFRHVQFNELCTYATTFAENRNSNRLCTYMLSFTFWLESKNLNFKDSALTPEFHFDYIV